MRDEWRSRFKRTDITWDTAEVALTDEQVRKVISILDYVLKNRQLPEPKDLPEGLQDFGDWSKRG